METKNDPEGKILFKKWLERRDFKEVNYKYDNLCHFDITACKNNVKYVFELKKRPIKSDLWGDNIIQEDKYNFLLPYDNDSDNQKVYIVNLFTDCMYINPLQAPHECQKKYCQKTNNWNRNKVEKILISYPHQNKFRFEYDNNN